jgi:anthranilate phosphoribosyltransferase
MADMAAQVLRRLGAGKALIVHSDDGLDEVSLGAATTAHEVTGNDVRTYKITPEDAGMRRLPLEDVRTGTKEENAKRLRAVLDGNESPDREYVLINAGAALYAAGKAPAIDQGVEMARVSIDTGAARRVLEAYITTSNSFSG